MVFEQSRNRLSYISFCKYKKLQEGHAAKPNVQKELRLVQLNAKQMCKKLHHELLRIRKNRDIAPGWRGLTSSLDNLTVGKLSNLYIKKND